MEAGYVSAIFGVAGMTLGGIMSFMTSWLTQSAQLRDKHREAERAIRRELFNSFITEASRLYGDALSHEKDDVTDLVQLYAMVARMRLLVSPAVITAAESAMDVIIATYLAPNQTLHEIHNMAQHGAMNFLQSFGEACRQELQRDLAANRGNQI